MALRPFLALVLVAACGGDRTFDLQFQALVHGEPLQCNKVFSNIGSTSSTVELREAKLYIYDPLLIRRDGGATPLVLEQDQRYQRDRLALLDFEDGTGSCAGGDSATRTFLRGVAADDDYVGVRFRVGIPEEMNHLDAATAPAPLNQPGMWWSWKGGFKYIRIDVTTRGNPDYYLHMGATSCEGMPSSGFSCASSNVAEVELSGFDLDGSAVTFDIASMWSDLDLDRQIDNQTDFVAGCMAFAGDPECPSMFTKLGLNIDGTSNGGQSFFTVGGAR